MTVILCRTAKGYLFSVCVSLERIKFRVMRTILRFALPAVYLCFSFPVQGQKSFPDRYWNRKKLKTHISTLPSGCIPKDAKQEVLVKQKASDYIKKQFKSSDFQAKGTDGYFEPSFFVDGAKNRQRHTRLIVNNPHLKVNDDFYPLPYSSMLSQAISLALGMESVIGIKAGWLLGKANIARKEFFVMESGTPDGNTPHGKFGDWADLRKNSTSPFNASYSSNLHQFRYNAGQSKKPTGKCAQRL